MNINTGAMKPHFPLAVERLRTIGETEMENVKTYPQKKLTAADAAVSGLFNGLLPPLQGLLMHLAVSSIYGMLFGLIRNWIRPNWLDRLPGWLVGLSFAMGLWIFAVTLLLPAAKSLMLDLPWVVFFTGHIAYGLVLGFTQKP
jgi:hypothetical protein